MMSIMRSLRSAIPGWNGQLPSSLISAQHVTWAPAAAGHLVQSCEQHQESKDGTQQSGIMPYSYEHSMPHAKQQCGHIDFKGPEKLLWA